MRVVLIVLLAVILVGLAVFVGITTLSMVPMVDDDKLAAYEAVANATGIGFGDMIHLDCVRYENDFDRADPESTAWLFLEFKYTVWESELVWDCDRNGENCGWETQWFIKDQGYLRGRDKILNLLSKHRAPDAQRKVPKKASEMNSWTAALAKVQYQNPERELSHRRIVLTASTVPMYEVAEGLRFNDDQMEWLQFLNDEMLAYEIYGEGLDFGDLPPSLPTNVYGLVAWPAPSYTRVSSSFGWRIHPVTGVRSFHEGIDISAKLGNPVIAAADGKVIQIVRNHATAGNYIVMQHVKDGMTYYTRYLHLAYIKTSVGQVTKVGDVIGAIGSTGRSTGPHLHFEVLDSGRNAMDPMKCF